MFVALLWEACTIIKSLLLRKKACFQVCNYAFSIKFKDLFGEFIYLKTENNIKHTMMEDFDLQFIANK